MRRRRSKPTQNVPAASAGPAGSSSRWPIAAAAILIALAALIAYSNCCRCPFIFDDHHDIVQNPSIMRLWPIWDIFFVPSEGKLALHGRPVVILSFAINYAVGGLEPFTYHVVNLLIHVLAGWTLFGIVRRTLLLPSLGGRFAAAATPLACSTALIWILHPLDTGAVTYIVQRFESMMALFYLLSLYATVRCGTSAHPIRWGAAAVAAALLGMGCKEVAISIPITIFLYDRAFLAGSFLNALRRRWGLYLGLAAAWAAFAVLLACSGSRGTWAGYRLPISWFEYARSQCGVLLHYLRLTAWPNPLVLDYGWPVARSVGEILPGAVVIGGLAAATVLALIRWPKWGFLGAWFFLILAPTSSVMPLADLAFEHRMYLPLAALATAVVLGAYFAGGWLVRRQIISPPRLRVIGVFLIMFAAVALAAVTYRRNIDFRSEVSIWEDTVAKRPHDVRAVKNLCLVLINRERLDEALFHLRKAVEINPDNSEAHELLAVTLASCNQHEEAQFHYRRALELDPNNAEAHDDLAAELANTGHVDEAIAHFREVLRLRPYFAGTHYNIGMVLMVRGQFDDAIACFRKALELNPSLPDAREQLDAALRAKQQSH